MMMMKTRMLLLFWIMMIEVCLALVKGGERYFEIEKLQF